MKLAEQIVQQLVEAGVERIYGVVGDSLNPIVDAVRRTGGSAKGGSTGCTCATRRPVRSPRAPRPS